MLYDEEFYEEQLALAKKVASMAHTNQFRSGGDEPYIVHPARVAKRVAKYLENTDMQEMSLIVQSVAWLHDVIEDSDGKIAAQVLYSSGLIQEIVEPVTVLTKKYGEFYDDYLIKVKANNVARIVKIHDMLDNLADNPTENQIRKYAKGLSFLLS